MFDIAAGIPSFNEEDSISNVVRQLDTGLREYFPGKKSVIINMDSASTDGTREKFTATPTAAEKKILMKEGQRGKGNMVEMLLNFMREDETQYGMMVDADLKSITPDWVYLMLKPLLNGYDYCTPLYSRHRYDGTITNLLVYPLVYGLYGCDIRQPIGGDFSFSAATAERWLNLKWHESTRYYGIDNFLTTSAVCGGLKICQIKLGAKIHKASGPKLGQMFREVVDTLFSNVYGCLDYIKEVKEVTTPALFGMLEDTPREVKLDCGEIREKTNSGMRKHMGFYKKILPEEICRRMEERISPEDWCIIVYSFLSRFKTGEKNDLIDALSILYFGRICAFIEETENMKDDQAEKAIRENAKIFFKKRSAFLSSIDTEAK